MTARANTSSPLSFGRFDSDVKDVGADETRDFAMGSDGSAYSSG